MTLQLTDQILKAGREAAYAKMTLDRNLPKPDMRIFSIPELYLLIKQEMEELGHEVREMEVSCDYSEDLLVRIRNEAGDVIAYASGLVAKCDQEINKLHEGKPSSLFDESK